MTSIDMLAQGRRHPAMPGILIVTGASGAGKTTLVRALEARQLAGVGCYYFDSIGVPTPEQMAREFGGGATWQEWATREWVARLCENADGVAVAILDGQVRPSVARAALLSLGAPNFEIVLVDCAPAMRNARLRGPRGQPDLAGAEMDCWAAYLRGQADALDLPIVDSTMSVDDGVAWIVNRVRRLATHKVCLLGPGDAGVLDHVAPGVFDNAVDPRWCAEFFADPRHHLAVALDGSTVVGMASAVHYVHPDKPPQLFINEVGVAPSHHRRGLGRRLLQALLERGRALECSEAWVLTDEANTAARELYVGGGADAVPEPTLMYTFRFVLPPARP